MAEDKLNSKIPSDEIHNDKINYPWAQQFLKVSTLCISKKRFEYLLANRLEDDSIPEDEQKLTPYETEIRNDISTRLRYWNIFSGIYIPTDNEKNIISGTRYWEVNIEKKYTYNSNRSDLSIRRYIEIDGIKHYKDDNGNIFNDVRIEFKRVINVTDDLKKIEKDYEKIIFDYCRINDAIEKKSKEEDDKILPYLFFWGWDIIFKDHTNKEINISKGLSNFITNLGNKKKIKGKINKDDSGFEVQEEELEYLVSCRTNYNIRYFPAKWATNKMDIDLKWGFIVLVELTDITIEPN